MEAGCLPQRQAEIHNLWRKILRLLCLSKSCKSLHLGFLLALGSLSLSPPDHTWRYLQRRKKKKILKVRNVSLTYFRNLYAVRDGDVTASRLCSICGRRRHQRCIICSTFVDFRVAVCDSSSQVTFVREVYF